MLAIGNIQLHGGSTYNLKMIETFVDRVGTTTADEQRKVVGQLDARLRRIACKKLWIASLE